MRKSDHLVSLRRERGKVKKSQMTGNAPLWSWTLRVVNSRYHAGHGSILELLGNFIFINIKPVFTFLVSFYVGR